MRESDDEPARPAASPEGAEIELTVESLAAGGDAVARDDAGRVTFVPGGAPGDRLLVRIEVARKAHARAAIADIIEPGASRIEPPCPLFADRRCGGCQWQHVAEGEQRAQKHALVAAALRHALAAGAELAPLVAPVAAHRWRRRARLHWFRPHRKRAALIGFYRPGTRRVTDVSECLQLEPALEIALGTIRAALAPALIGIGELSLLAGHTGQVHVSIGGRCPAAAAERLVGQGGIAGVRLGTQTFGAESIELEAGLPGRADWFAQASLAGNRALLTEVERATSPRAGLRVVEFYAGSGNLTRVFGDATEVVAIDSRKPPWRVPGARFRVGPAGRVAEALASAGETFDLAVLDPPRTGAAELIEPLANLAPARIVYVSCDPATLARDVTALGARGYRVTRVVPMDLMPQTAHVETVVTLVRD